MIIIRDFNTCLSVINRASRQKIRKDIKRLNDTINQLDLIDIWRTLHPTTAEEMFFPGAHGIFIKIEHTLGHKTVFSKFKIIQTIELN